MALLIFNFFTSLGMKVPAVFYYFSTRMLLSALTSFAVTLALGPITIKKLFELKTGRSIRVEDCPVLKDLHSKKKQTPTMGGVLINLSILVSLLLWMDWHSVYTLILLVSLLVLGVVGGVDDYLKIKNHDSSKGLKGRKKLFIQLFFSLLLACYLLIPEVSQSLEIGNWFKAPQAQMWVGNQEVTYTLSEAQKLYFFPFVKSPIFVLTGLGVIVGFFITLFVISGASNAVNLSDGLDGLASGLVLLVAFVFAIFAFVSNHAHLAKYLNILYLEECGEIAIFLCAIFGATLGFLWYNGHPAQVFMGDVGSIPLGGLIGVCAVLLRREFLLALVGGVFVCEALSVILQVFSYKLRGGKRIFLCAPLHHHYEYKGWAETKVVIRFWVVALVLAIVGIASLKFQ